MSEKDRAQTDLDLFDQAIAGARPLKQDRRGPFRRGRPPIPQQSRADEQAVLQSLLSDGPDLDDIETGEELLFMRPGLQHTAWRKFRRGQFSIQDELDLHGRTVAEARDLVSLFLRQSRDAGKRCVRIIHGKGLSSLGRIPVLKSKVNVWLRQKDEVMAFCSARPADGGTGAVYVLIRGRS